jgi:hypothetical protein
MTDDVEKTSQPGQQEQGNQLLQMALASPIPRIHVNGFANALLDSGDFLTVLTMNSQPSAILNWNIHSAKSFLHALKTTLESYEAVTGHHLMDVDEIQKRQKELQEKST